MYSQNDEERVILEYFGDKVGKFYDIGAWSGPTFSNTWALMERGWSGVLVEPSPSVFVKLLKTTEPFGDRVKLVNAALAPGPALMEFYDADGDAVGSLDPTHAAKWKLTGRKFITHTLGAKHLFGSFGPAEFINLDVEVINWLLFQHLPFDWPELRLICVEYDGLAQEMADLVAPHGFKPIHQTSENLLVAR